MGASVLRSTTPIRLIAAVVLCFAVPAVAAPGAAEAFTPTASQAACQRVPLSTKGARIVNRDGETCTLTGVNWFGFETQNHVVHGLWARGYDQMLAQISELGFNVIRLPFSIAAIDSQQMTGIDYAAGRNSELAGKRPLAAMELIVKEAAAHDLLVLPDLHSLKDDDHYHGLWYDDRYSERDFSTAWQRVAQRLADEPNVIGADVKNEPHGAASWGDGSQTDWRREARTIGNEIHAVAPHWLIVVEGIEGPAPGQQLDRHWWGGNLEGVRTKPVLLDRPGKLIYSPHEYGPGVFAQPWFDQDDFTETLYDRWSKGFGYLLDEGIAPVLVGEFGGRETGVDSKEGRWQRQFMDYLSQRGISFTYWSWNPNSGDTGGVLNDDWRTVNQAKVDLLQRAMRAERIEFGSAPPPDPGPDPPPDPDPDPTPDPAPGPTPIPGGDIRAELVVDSDWGTGYCATLRAHNASATSVAGLGFVVEMPGTITSTWNGAFSGETGTIAIALPDWGSSLAPGATYASTGLCAIGAKPTAVSATFAGQPAPSPHPPPEPAPGGIETTIVVDSEWESGWCVTLRARNRGAETVERLGFRFRRGGAISTSWNGNFKRKRSRVTVALPGWAQTLASGAVYDSTGLCGSGTKPSDLVALSDGKPVADRSRIESIDEKEGNGKRKGKKNRRGAKKR